MSVWICRDSIPECVVGCCPRQPDSLVAPCAPRLALSCASPRLLSYDHCLLRPVALSCSVAVSGGHASRSPCHDRVAFISPQVLWGRFAARSAAVTPFVGVQVCAKISAGSGAVDIDIRRAQAPFLLPGVACDYRDSLHWPRWPHFIATHKVVHIFNAEGTPNTAINVPRSITSPGSAALH